MKRSLRNIIRILLVLGSTLASPLYSAIGNVWHIPTSSQNGVPTTMRDPSFPSVSQSTNFYQGAYKGDGANQIGGSFVYRFDNGSWQSATLNYHSDVESGTVNHNQFWNCIISMPASAGDLDYYFIVEFDNRDTTYLFGNDSKSSVEADAQINPTSLSVTYPLPELTINGVNSNYSKSNFYIDENNDTSFPNLELRLNPNIGNVDSVQIFTNLNNRDLANEDYNSDGVEDGIFPVDGNTITTADTGAYFCAYEMVDSNNDGTYELDLNAEKTGAYRITARYRVSPLDDWIWLGDSGIRDHAVIIGPKAARDMRIYELHVANSNATSDSFADRGTFEDLHETNENISIDWLNDLGINWIWFQPIHPQGIEGRQTDPATSGEYEPGSPYSIRNFWEINPLYTSNYDGTLPDPVSNPTNYTAAMTAFQDFVTAADEGEIQLMLDFPFNHTAPDVALGQKGVEIFAATDNLSGWSAGDKIRDRVPQFFSTDGGEGPSAYSNPAQSSSNIAVAPDRDDFDKWSDVRDVFFGRYATLVTGYPGEDSSRNTVRNESDSFDYSSLVAETIGVWQYFGEVLPYWIIQSGHRGYNSSPSDGANRDSLDNQGIDGLRKDFGQGLPPQCMEYIINRTHEFKWNFVFMTESLDGEEVTYRSSRHFAVLNENIIFPLQAATTTSGYRGIFDDRRNAYDQSLVLLNNTSHDEAPYADSWEALIRYATVSTNDGSPMIMYGQEIGAGQKFQESLPQGAFDWYENNFEKDIPSFKKWNSMQAQWTAWTNNDAGVQFLYPVYSGIGKAREFSPALRSSNRWYLNPNGSLEPDEDIFAVAKYTEANALVAEQDVVLAFTNLDRDNTKANEFGIPTTLADLIGLQVDRNYNAKNIAAYLGRDNEHPTRRDTWLWGSGYSRDDLVNNGLFVSLNPVPGDDLTWSTNPYEAQYLKIYDVTAPVATPGQAQQPKPFDYEIGDTVIFDWPDVAPDAGGVVPHYEVTPYINSITQPTVITTVSEYTMTASESDLVAITVKAVNPEVPSNAGPSSVASANIKLLPATMDEDGDGMSNGDEDSAGTNPFDNGSNFSVSSQTLENNGDVTITWTPVAGKTYKVQSSLSLAPDSWIDEASGLNSGIFADQPEISETKKFYRVVVE
jgi:hypothetical protein